MPGVAADYGGVDNIIPTTIVKAMPAELVGLAIIGPLAASISTISGLLIVASSAIIKDVYLHWAEKNKHVVLYKLYQFLGLSLTFLFFFFFNP